MLGSAPNIPDIHNHEFGRRCVCGSIFAYSRCPQYWQKRASSTTSAPQLGQIFNPLPTGRTVSCSISICSRDASPHELHSATISFRLTGKIGMKNNINHIRRSMSTCTVSRPSNGQNLVSVPMRLSRGTTPSMKKKHIANPFVYSSLTHTEALCGATIAPHNDIRS